VAEGTQTATVYKPISKLARSALDAATLLANRNKVVSGRWIADGRRKIPYIAIAPEAVTEKTLDSTVVKDGYHTREEIYRNVGGFRKPGQ
jgi:D-xylose transport system substrate-binding protein